MINQLPKTIQEEVLDILESREGETFVKSSKIKQARMVVRLRQKYNFRKKSLGMN